ncbi:MAG: hypothetical protein QXU98_08210 [Candidatus Parvarchaeota archaeon]
MAEANIDDIVKTIIEECNLKLEHNETVSQIEQVFRKSGFYTTREYPIYKIKDGSGRAGRIDLVARRGKFRVAVEYDHHALIKWKSFQKVVQIKPDVAIAITGNGALGSNLERAEKYRKYLNSELYIISLKQRRYQKFERQIN